MKKASLSIFSRPVFYLWLVFALVLGMRLLIAFSNQYFNYDAYNTLRQVTSIIHTGAPLYNDPLSYGGKTLLFAPLYYYILSFFSLFIPLAAAAKIFPNIFASLIVIIVYYIVLRITKSSKISLVSAFMSGFIPIYFLDVNSASTGYFSILLILTIIYSIFRIGERKYVDYSLILMFLLVLTSPVAFVLVLGLLLYLLLLKLENLEIQMKELEIILFFTFLVFWVNLLIYKNAFLSEGFLVIWQNIPVQILSSFFGELSFLEVVITVSVIPLLFGVYALYSSFHKDSTKESLLLIAFGTGSFILLWFKLIDFVTGLMLISITLVILTAYSLKRASDFLERSKLVRYQKLMLILILVLFVVTAIVPSYTFGTEKAQESPSSSDVKVLAWARDHLPPDAVIASTLDSGSAVSYYSGRGNIMDTNFLMIQNIDRRLDDLNSIFTTGFETEAISDLNRYHARYILMDLHAIQTYNMTSLSYITDQKCFKLLYSYGNADLYYTYCQVNFT